EGGTLHKVRDAFVIVVELLEGSAPAAVPRRRFFRWRLAWRSRAPLEAAVGEAHASIGEIDAHSSPLPPGVKAARGGAFFPAPHFFQPVDAFLRPASRGFVSVRGLTENFERFLRGRRHRGGQQDRHEFQHYPHCRMAAYAHFAAAVFVRRRTGSELRS